MSTVVITAQIAAILGVLHVIFTLRVGMYRASNKISLGDGGDKELRKRIRAHGNFIETVPIALILILLNELSFLSPVYLYALGGALIVARLMHYASIAFSTPLAIRFVGMSTTLLVILIASLLLIL